MLSRLYLVSWLAGRYTGSHDEEHHTKTWEICRRC